MGTLVQRMMDAEEDANLHHAVRDFEHTIQPSSTPTPTSSAKLIETVLNPPQNTSGVDLHQALLERAQHREHLDNTLGRSTQFYDYTRSAVGSAAANSDLRRQLSHFRKRERIERELRFGHKPSPRNRRTTQAQDNRRQSFNATGAVESESRDTRTTRQGFNANEAPRHIFREPPSRNYNPFA